MAIFDSHKRIRVDANILPSAADFVPAITQGHRDRAWALSRLDEHRNFDLPGVCLEAHHVSIRELDFCGRGGRHRSVVSPGDFADWVWKFLEPRIVGVTAIAQRDTLIKLDFVVLCRVCRQAFCLLVTDRSDRSSPIVVKLRFDYSSV